MANTIKLFDLSGKSKKTIDFAKELIVDKPHKQAMFDCVIAENASERQGTHSTLTKGEVRGGGKKPWKQKHTGKARTGSTRNPHWVGGGIVFGPKPNRNYLKKVNAKVTKLAMKSILSIRLKEEALLGLENAIEMKKPHTKDVAAFLKTMSLDSKKVLFVLNDCDNLFLSINNIKNANAKVWNRVSVRDLMHHNVVIIQEGSIEKMKGVYA